jgi:hypothetical protein
MRRLWREIKDVYLNFYEWFKGDIYLNNNKNGLYHRLSLLKKIIFDTRENQLQRYRSELNVLRDVYNNIINNSKDSRLEIINQKIREKLCGEDNIEDIILKASYDKEHFGKIEPILLMFNLSTLENAAGYGGRFPFEAFKKEKWEKEHIFAEKSLVAGLDAERQKALLNALASQTEMDAYREYKILLSGNTGDDFNELAFLKDYGIMIEAVNKYKDHGEDMMADALFEENGPIMAYLRDDNMGNMSLLTKPDNIRAGNKSYAKKGKMIKEMFVNEEFIPICTMNVFCDFYSMGKNYNEFWLYERRLEYLKQMLKSVKLYLGENNEQ